MKPVIYLAAAMLAAVVLSGCLYSHVTIPLSTTLDETELGQKQGKASIYSLVWLFAWGDAGAAAAAKNGGITTMKHMDMESYVILFGIYTRTTTIVYGD
jgi:hypothetical protein